MSFHIHPCRFLVALLFALCSSMAQEGSKNNSPAPVAKLSATVFAATGAEIQLTLTGELVPNAGDKVDFFFKVPGLDDEVAVGTGTVLSADGTTATAKFEQGTGKPQAGQLARIHSAMPRKAGAPPALPATTTTQPAPAVNVQKNAALISWLGLLTDRVPVEMIRALQLRPRSGAQIIGIVPGSPAALAGLQKDDIICEIDGKIVREGDIERLTAATQPGAKLTFAVSRNLRLHMKEVAFAAPLSDAEFSEKIRLAAEGGDAAAQMVHGGALMAGAGQPANPTEGMKWLTRAAGQDLRKAQFALACIEYEKQNDAVALAKAIEWFRRAAALGDAMSQLALAGHYHLKRDFQQAVLYARLAAEQGETQAENLYGTMLLNGEGVPANPAEGVKWITFAAAAGLPDAQFVLGQAQLLGIGTKRDATAGLKNLRAAADANIVEAMNALGTIYDEGKLVKKNPATAREWRQKAATQSAAAATAAAPKPAPNAGGTASQPPAAALPPPENPAASTVPAGTPEAFFGTYRGEVVMAGKAACPVTITILNYQGELRLALIPNDQKNKSQPSYFTSIGGMTAKGNTLSSTSASDYQSTSSSYELRGDEITGTISYQEKDPAKGTVKPAANYKVRATRVR